jgi:hypothetical protein
VAQALRAGRAVAAYLNSPAARDLEGPARGEALEQLGTITSLLGAAQNGWLRRFDADGGHDADGYASAAAWLAAWLAAWSGGCDRRPAVSDVHHVTHKKDGGPTSVKDCALLCNYHHDVCIHRLGWKFELLPDGSTRATSPDGKTILRSHGPPPPQQPQPDG